MRRARVRAPGGEAAQGDRLVEGVRIVAAVVLHLFAEDGGPARERHPLRADQVPPPDLDGIDPEYAGGAVDEPFARGVALEAAGGAVGAGRGLVGEHAPHPAPVRLHLVGAGQHPGAQARHDRAVGAEVGAHVVDRLRVEPQEPPVRIEGEGQLVALLARVVDGAQVLRPVLDPLDGAAEPERRARDQEVFGVELPAGPEPAAHLRLDEADAVLGPAEHRGEHPAVEVRDLGRPPDREAGAALGAAVRPRIGRGDQPPGLHRHGGVPPGAEREPHGPARPRERRIEVSEALLDERGEVVRGVVEEGGGGRGGPRVGDRGQGLEVHLHPLRGVLGGGPAAGDDEGDGLSHVAHPIDGQGVLQVAKKVRVGNEADGDGPERVRQIVRGEDGRDPRRGPRRRRVHRPEPGMGVRASHHRGVEHVGEAHVVHVDALSPEAPRVLEAPHRAPDHVRRTSAPGAPGAARPAKTETPEARAPYPYPPRATAARASPNGPGISIRRIDRYTGRPGQAAPPRPLPSPHTPHGGSARTRPSAPVNRRLLPATPRSGARPAPRLPPSSQTFASGATASRRSLLYDALLGPHRKPTSPNTLADLYIFDYEYFYTKAR